ncbi:MAG: PAS domain S-box protein [Armatimonadetes bacterium]|nr:PAS domain S-box protein [Armatimonadota bacterium]
MDRPAPELSEREQQLLTFASEGLTDTAIAHKLGISEATVGTYWGRVRIKLGPHSRTELVAMMLRTQQEEAIRSLREEYEELIGQLSTTSSSGHVLNYRDLLENAPDAMVLVTDDGSLEYANTAALELFGYAEGELTGQNMSRLVPERFRDQHGAHLQDYVMNPERRQMGAHLRTPAVCKDGTEILIRAALSAVPREDGVVVTCVIRPA